MLARIDSANVSMEVLEEGQIRQESRIRVQYNASLFTTLLSSTGNSSLAEASISCERKERTMETSFKFLLAY